MSDVRVIFQARTGSTRLPAKTLLPLAGFPVAVLAALRAGNTGINVCVATSLDSSDDRLAEILEQHEVKTFRGSLHNVLQRLLDASADLADDAWIVRCTADNVFPDGKLIETMLREAETKKFDYFENRSPWDGLPYGVSVEMFRAGLIRSVSETASSEDREHVTVTFRRRHGTSAIYKPSLDRSLSHLRCTIDTIEDYHRVSAVFTGIREPRQIGWKELCDRLSRLPDAPNFRIPFSEKRGRLVGSMTLGTAQLGLPHYGIANAEGRPSADETRAIIQCAMDHGVTVLDTAPAYGLAEGRIGDTFAGTGRECMTVTKLDPLADLPDDAGEFAVRNAVAASVLRSCRALRRQKLDVLLLHRWSHRRSNQGCIWRELLKLQEDKVIGELGASVYDLSEALEALVDPQVLHLQIPINLLDDRWREPAFRSALLARPEVTIYARSVFLQGLLVGSPMAWPHEDEFDPAETLRAIDDLVARLKRSSRADLCVAYVRAMPGVDSLVIGLESRAQLEANLSLFRNPPLSSAEVELVNDRIGAIPERILNPSTWGARA